MSKVLADSASSPSAEEVMEALYAKEPRQDSFYENLLPAHETAVPMGQRGIRTQLIEILKVQDLYAIRIPIGRLWSLLNSTESRIEDCVRLIELDPFLKEKILRLANISIAADRVDTATLADAILQLGFSKTRQMTFNACVYRQFAKFGLPEGWDLFWARSLFVARATQRICAAYMKTDGSEYVAGLLQNVGWLLLHKFFGPEFRQLFRSGVPVDEAESRLLSTTHAEISGALCALGLFPERIVQGVILSAQPLLRNGKPPFPPEKSPELLAVILHVANGLADAAEFHVIGRRKIDVESVQRSDEARWLNHYGPPLDFALLVKEETLQTGELHPLFFGEKIAV